jgi:hypothetical protein
MSAGRAQERLSAPLLGGGDGAIDARSNALGRLKAGIFAALVLATIASLFIAQRAKHVPTPVERFILSPRELVLAPGAASGAEQLSFQLEHRSRVSVEIVNSQGEVAAQLVHELPWTAYLRLCLQWNGHRGIGYALYRNGALLAHQLALCAAAPVTVQPRGRLAEAGEYRVRVDLRNEGRTVISPIAFTVRRVGARPR